jgi:hypothetical protein
MIPFALFLVFPLELADPIDLLAISQLPSRAITDINLSVARSFLAQAATRCDNAISWQQDYYQHAWEEHLACWRAWDALDDVHRASSYESRFKACEKLKERIGEVNFAQGWMPPPVPYWRYTYID